MGYIFETEIDAIMNAVRARTIGEEDGITLRELLAAQIHPAIKAYYRAEVEKLLATERANEVRSKRFPYSHPEVLSLQNQVDRLLVHHYHFDASEFDTLLDQSVHFTFNYLCRPQFTLLNFVMANQRRVSTFEIEKKLEYLVDYQYFPELIRRYFSDHGLVEVTYEEFKSLLEKVDQEVVSRHSPEELARMLRAVSRFVDENRMQPRDDQGEPLLPTNAAIVFFEDKQLLAVKVRLEFERDANTLDMISLAQLAELIERVQNVEEFNVALASVDAPYVPDTIDPATGKTAEPIVAGKNEGGGGRKSAVKQQRSEEAKDEPVWPFADSSEVTPLAAPNLPEIPQVEWPLPDPVIPIRTEEDIPIRTEEDLPTPVPEPRPTPAPVPTPMQAQTPADEVASASEFVVQTRFTGHAASSEPASAEQELRAPAKPERPDVRNSFTKAEKKKFIKTIFDGDEHAYEATMNEFNNIPTWQETSMFLDSLFVSLDVDPYSEPAIHLTDRLYTRFYPDQSAPAE